MRAREWVLTVVGAHNLESLSEGLTVRERRRIDRVRVARRDTCGLHVKIRSDVRTDAPGQLTCLSASAVGRLRAFSRVSRCQGGQRRHAAARERVRGRGGGVAVVAGISRVRDLVPSHVDVLGVDQLRIGAACRVWDTTRPMNRDIFKFTGKTRRVKTRTTACVPTTEAAAAPRMKDTTSAA